MDFLKPMAVLIDQPWLALIPVVLFVAFAAATRSGVALVVAALWFVYCLYEFAKKLRILCSGECNIRIDLLLLYPLLLAATAIGLLAAGLAAAGGARPDGPRTMEGRRGMQTVAPTASALLPRQVWALLALYALASLIHFVHNAESIALYPNMPAWLTREKVYLAWLAFTGVGVVALAFAAAGWRVAAALCLAAYGALGFVGLGHYTLAPHSGHTIAMNLSIWFEAIAGGLLAVSSVRLLVRAADRAKNAPGA